MYVRKMLNKPEYRIRLGFIVSQILCTKLVFAIIDWRRDVRARSSCNHWGQLPLFVLNNSNSANHAEDAAYQPRYVPFDLLVVFVC